MFATTFRRCTLFSNDKQRCSETEKTQLILFLGGSSEDTSSSVSTGCVKVFYSLVGIKTTIYLVDSKKGKRRTVTQFILHVV